MRMYEIEFSEGVENDLRSIPVYDRNVVLDAIEEQLMHTPGAETRNRKMLTSFVPPFESVPPIRELRVGEHRVFYDLDEEFRKVYVRAIRRKPPHKTTEEVL